MYVYIYIIMYVYIYMHICIGVLKCDTVHWACQQGREPLQALLKCDLLGGQTLIAKHALSQILLIVCNACRVRITSCLIAILLYLYLYATSKLFILSEHIQYCQQLINTCVHGWKWWKHGKEASCEINASWVSAYVYGSSWIVWLCASVFSRPHVWRNAARVSFSKPFRCQLLRCQHADAK